MINPGHFEAVRGRLLSKIKGKAFRKTDGAIGLRFQAFLPVG